MVKQKAFKIRIFALGEVANGAIATEEVEAAINDAMSRGWQLFSTERAETSNGVVKIIMIFVQYEDEPAVVGGSDVAEVRTKRPYHKRSEADGEQPA